MRLFNRRMHYELLKNNGVSCKFSCLFFSSRILIMKIAIPCSFDKSSCLFVDTVLKIVKKVLNVDDIAEEVQKLSKYI